VNSQNFPGCFAAASVFSHDSEACKVCHAFAACSEESLLTLAKIRHIINVDDLLKRHEKARRSSQRQIKAADDEAKSKLPPGNIQSPLTNPVVRKTEVAKVHFEVLPDQQEIIATLPLKSQKVALSLVKSGFIDRIRKDLQEGRNTFATAGPAFVREALSMLLNGGFTRAGLKDHLVKALDWNEATAASHVSQVTSILLNFRIAKEANGQITVF